MEERFINFTLSIAKLNKQIQKLKTDGMKLFGLKGVHTLCVYQLLTRPDGMTSTEIAACCDLDAALVSRTLSHLLKNDFVLKDGAPGKYLARYRLTPKGTAVASEVRSIINGVQDFVDVGITAQELEIFYSVLAKLEHNFETLVERPSLALPLEKEN